MKHQSDQDDHQKSHKPQTIAEGRRILAQLNRDIKERQDYLAEQTALVEETVNQLNQTLLDFRDEVENLQDMKAKLMLEINRLTEDKDLLENNTKIVENKFLVIDDAYQHVIMHYRSIS